MRQLAAWLPVAAWMGLIYMLSDQAGLRVAADDAFDFLLRKGAHVFAYAVLAVLLLRALGRGTPRAVPVAVAAAVLYGALDEIHQASVAQRNGNPADVAIDAFGALLGAGAWLWWGAGTARHPGAGPGELRIEAATEIEAPPEAVWAVLARGDGWAEWNPHQRVDGRFAEGVRIRVTSHPPGGRRLVIRPRVLRVAPGRELAWLGWWIHPRIFAGEHRFAVEPLAPGRTRFLQAERFTGALLPLYARIRLGQTEGGFRLMNAALKRHVEAGTIGPGTADEPAAGGMSAAEV